MQRVAGLVLVVACFGVASSEEPVGSATVWPMDVVMLKNGGTFQGRILSETGDGLLFRVVRRSAGRPTVTLTTFIARREVEMVRRLTAAEREALSAKLAELDPNGEGERERMEALTLQPVEWLGTPNAGLRYRSDHFVLISGSSEEITRRAAVRLEQIYAAFARILPPRHPSASVTTVYLAGKAEDYATLVGTATGTLLNPAIFDPTGNRIVCGRDLRRLAQELAKAQEQNQEKQTQLREYESKVRRLYQNQRGELDRFLRIVSRERRRIRLADQTNSVRFDQATRQLFALLYHEAFHSYVANFVYPAMSSAEVKAGKGTGELPRWLNEGLAQIFETAVLEAGELRIGHADRSRLEKVQDRLRGVGGRESLGLIPLVNLLRSGQDQFLAMHSNKRDLSDQMYLTSWALTHYLTFDRHIVGAKELDDYLIALNSGHDPVKAFETWTGQDSATFEREWHAYLKALQPNGTAKR